MENNIDKTLKFVKLETKYKVIVKALIAMNFNKTKAAKVLNIDRKTIYNKLKEAKEAGIMD